MRLWEESGDALKPRLASTLLWVISFRRVHGRSPSYRETALGLGLGSTRTVSARFRALRRLGLITWEPYKAGTLRPLVDELEPRCCHCAAGLVASRGGWVHFQTGERACADAPSEADPLWVQPGPDGGVRPPPHPLRAGPPLRGADRGLAEIAASTGS